MSTSFRFVTSNDDEGVRLDQVLAQHVNGLSRTAAKRVLSEGGVFVDRRRVKVASRAMRAGQRVEVHIAEVTPEKRSERRPNEPFPPIPVIHLTDDYVVIDKPSGVPSAPTPQSDRRDIVAFVSSQLREMGHDRCDLFIVHRLDTPTSGLMVLARSKSATADFSRQLRKRTMQRKYLALLHGQFAGDGSAGERVVNTPIEGQRALTTFVPRCTRGPVTLVEARLDTGRTHQIRIHALSLGMPVCGDRRYKISDAPRLPSRPSRLSLHAAKLEFTDPKTREIVRFESPLPTELKSWFESLEELPNGP